MNLQELTDTNTEHSSQLNEQNQTIERQDAPNINISIGTHGTTLKMQSFSQAIPANEGVSTEEGRQNSLESLEKRVKKLQDMIASELKKIEKDFS